MSFLKGLFVKKSGEPTGFSKLLAKKDGTSTTFSKVLNIALDVIEYIPGVGTVAKGAEVGVKLAGKAAVKAAVQAAGKEALKIAGTTAVKVAQQSAQSIRGSVAAKQFNNPVKMGMGDSNQEDKPVQKSSGMTSTIMVSIAVILGWLFLRKRR